MFFRPVGVNDRNALQISRANLEGSDTDGSEEQSAEGDNAGIAGLSRVGLDWRRGGRGSGVA